ncbi:inactive TPR repeat-containing thioredoxin TTL3 isoform X9 [Coregonus clupeaformis]|uniref:inactive TPR repeat-containing thioredoxin TTL3 isoform X9 n=1 Tax=Coregonus clupeaformis TaxID=59861 RepID=UPI001BE10406|nr:inactive TPR repeat-containing thioredoxin TTL3 isoform X9 [Coregonus clupeaformis]
MSNIRKRDWKPDHVIIQENPHILQTHEALVDLISGRDTKHTFMDLFNSGMFGLDFVNPMIDYVDDDEDYYDDRKLKNNKAYCGFAQNFLGHSVPKKSLTPHPRIRQLTPEEAEKNARELIEEENKLKEKAEKKRLKKMRQKERKRAGKEKEPEEPGRSSPSENPEPGPGRSSPSENQEPGPGRSSPSENQGPGRSSPSENQGPGPGRSSRSENQGPGPGRSIPSENQGPGRSIPSENQGPGPGRSIPSENQGPGPGRSSRSENQGPGPGRSIPSENQGPGPGRSIPSENQGPGRSSRSENQRPGPGRSIPSENQRPGPGRSIRSENQGPGPGRSIPSENQGPGPGRSSRSENQRPGPGRSIPSENQRPGPGRSIRSENQGPGPGRSSRSENQGPGPGRSNRSENQRPGPGRSIPSENQGPGPGRSSRSENQGGDINIEREREEKKFMEESLGLGPGGSRQQEAQDPPPPLEENCGSSNEHQEEELDMSSCFISTASCIAKRQPQQNPKPEKKTIIQKPHEPAVERQEEEDLEEQREVIVRKKEKKAEANVDDIVKRSTELALIGNQFAACGQLEMAVKYFTDAIKHNPTEFKLFGNRSFCYEKMQQYDRALCDAELALSMEPGWIKGLYRKGKALSGLKRYFEACQTYKEVLKQDGSCSDAAQELMNVQIMQLMEMGFNREQSCNALIAHGDFEKAVDVLSGIEDEYVSNDFSAAATSAEDSETWEGVGPRPKPLLQTRPKPRSPTPGPVYHVAPGGSRSNLFPVYVGCLGPNTTQPMLHSFFSSAGTIHSIKMLLSSHCAFVNYTSMDDCERAIRTMHGKVLNGVMLAVRHPDKVIQKKLGFSQLAATNPTVANALERSQECYFWRTTGCVRHNCIFRHVPQHKGIDRDKVNQ